jgi:hypothetical protein
MNKVIYLGTTFKCSACKLQEHLLKETLLEYPDIELKVCDYLQLPEWLQTQVKLSDFPVTIFIKDGIIKYTVVGTKSVKHLKEILSDIGF